MRPTWTGKIAKGHARNVTLPVQSLNDWEKIVPLDASNPVFVREFTAIKLIRQQLGADVHILQTIFSPLSTAQNLARDRVWEDLRAHPDVLQRALQAITETTARFAIANLRAGADAIFFATQTATAQSLTRDEFRAFGAPVRFASAGGDSRGETGFHLSAYSRLGHLL